METQAIRKIKLCFDKREDKNTIRYFFESQDPLEDVKVLRMVAEHIVLKPAYVECIGEDCVLIVNPTVGNRIKLPICFRAFPQQLYVAVLLEGDIAEFWLSSVFHELGWEYEFESEVEYRQRRLRESLNDFDMKVLELRGQGLSLWGICKKLNCTMAKVRWSLQKLTLVPECAQKLGVYKPLSWEERFPKKS